MPSDLRIVCVVPTIRPDSHASFVKAWTPLFEKHKVTLVTVWDGDAPEVTVSGPTQNHIDSTMLKIGGVRPVYEEKNRDLFCRRTDACRNLGFVVAASMDPTHVLTMDDDCLPPDHYDWEETAGQQFWRKVGTTDPIQSHLDALDRRVPLGWMNTAHDTDLYLRGVPYGIRDEAPVMLSHGVWVGTPDFDGETQLRLEGHEVHKQGDRTIGVSCELPHSLPYYVGPIPRGVLFPLCGMNVMVKAEALPYLYFAPMGQDAGITAQCPTCSGSRYEVTGGCDSFDCRMCGATGKVPALHRFADIFMGIFAKQKFDELGWGCVTGYSTVHHTRASNARKNFEQEKLGREWMEFLGRPDFDTMPKGEESVRQMTTYFDSYADKRTRYEALVKSLLEKK